VKGEEQSTEPAPALVVVESEAPIVVSSVVPISFSFPKKKSSSRMRQSINYSELDGKIHDTNMELAH
jgi:hypothetical protein